MACLALSLQPVQGPDILLQTKTWFPPARAIAAAQSFKTTRSIDVANRYSDDATNDRLGDDPLAASSGQVVVGNENKFRVVYRLVNSVYVLGITNADEVDSFANVFDCTTTVNQAVSVLVTACRGVDVTVEKLARKYSEVYLALQAVLQGVTAARLSLILSAVHHDGSALLSPFKPEVAEAEDKARGAASWNIAKGASEERLANTEVLSVASFDLPEATLAAGDAAMATFAPPPTQQTFEKEAPPEKKPTNEVIDPFAASETAHAEVAGAFKKDPSIDQDAALAGLQVNPAGTKPGAGEIVMEEGFEGEYGGLDFGDDSELEKAFTGGGLLGDEGDAWGGGLDASEFGAPLEVENAFGGGLGGSLADIGIYGGGAGKDLEVALAGGSVNGFAVPLKEEEAGGLAGVTPQESAQSKLPLLWLTEEVSAEFQGMALLRVRLQGALHMLPPQKRLQATKDDMELSVRLEGASGIQRAAVQSKFVSSLGGGFFHVRAPPTLTQEITLVKFRLQPRYTPLPLRVRLHTRRSNDALSLMIQFVGNPFLARPLENVVFVLSLPFSPAAIKLNPSATLNATTKELRWTIPSILPKGVPQRLRAQIPVMPEELMGGGKERTPEEKEEEEVRKAKELAAFKVRVEFSGSGHTLSGITVGAAGSTNETFVLSESKFEAAEYVCSA